MEENEEFHDALEGEQGDAEELPMQKRPTRTIKKPSRYAAVASEIKETVLQHEKDKLVETRVEDRAV